MISLKFNIIVIHNYKNIPGRKTKRVLTPNILQFAHHFKTNQRKKMTFDRVKVSMFKKKFKYLFMVFQILNCFTHMDLSENSVALIGAEISRFDPSGSVRFDQISLARISDYN